MIKTIPIKKPRRHYEESDNQQALIDWWRMAHRGLGIKDEGVLFSIPNGAVRRGSTSSGILIAEGLRAGIPDLFLAVARQGYHGLFIEMKSQTGAVSVYQKAAMAALNDQLYVAIIARSFDEARQVIEKYLAGQLSLNPEPSVNQGQRACLPACENREAKIK